MEKTIELWAKTYYTNLLWYVSMLIAVIAGIKYYRKERTYLFFLTYATSGLVIFLGLDILRYELYFQGRRNSLLLETCNILFAIIETTAFNMFFYKVNFKFHKLIMAIIYYLDLSNHSMTFCLISFYYEGYFVVFPIVLLPSLV